MVCLHQEQAYCSKKSGNVIFALKKGLLIKLVFLYEKEEKEVAYLFVFVRKMIQQLLPFGRNLVLQNVTPLKL